MNYETLCKIVEKAVNEPIPAYDSLCTAEFYPYYRFLYYLIKEMQDETGYEKPCTTLEIGTYRGYGAMYMGAALRDTESMALAIDLNKADPPEDTFQMITGDSTDINTVHKVEKYVEHFGKIGVLFQDSSHHYLPSKREWELYRGMMDKHGIWICDDITPAFHDPKVDPKGKSMVEYWNEIPEDFEKKHLFLELHHGGCVGVILL